MRTLRFWASALVLSFASVVASAQEDYPVNFDKSQDYTHSSRYLSGVTFTCASGGTQSVSIPAPRKVYTDLTSQSFSARAGEEVTVTFQFNGNWMHGYVFLDRGNDGAFEATLNDDSTIPEGSDIMAFSYAEAVLDSGTGKNSAGASLNSPNVLNPPTFTLPAGLEEGFYRLRFKVDWAGIDPGGRVTETNGILANGGGIVDVLLNVHGENAQVTTDTAHGTLTLADGSLLESGQTFPFAEPLTLRVVPETGYTCDFLRVRHGHGLQGDPVVHGNTQWTESLVPAYLFEEDRVTLPASCMDGQVEITAVFVPVAQSGEAQEEYALSFSPEDSGQATFALQSFQANATQGGSSAWSRDETMVQSYADCLAHEVSVVPGDSVSLTGTALEGKHVYLYVDLNNDGHFLPSLNEDGLPSVSGELVSFTSHNGKNSHGEAAEAGETGALFSLPAFKLNEMLPLGMYRARLKVDVDNTDPAGSEELVAQGGCVLDFLLNVHAPSGNLEVFATHGNLYGTGNTALPLSLPYRSSLSVVPKPVALDYVAENIVVRHGHNLTGEQYVHGNRQWSEYAVPVGSFTLKADSVNGDVWLTIAYAPNENAAYQLVFSDEFDAADGTQENTEKWMRCQRYNATWNRWCSDRPEVIFHEDGKLVARAVPNPDTAADPVPMITGGVKSMGIFGFTYGLVECRALTQGWKGNFPAIWMMPEDQSDGWPGCGEIDIFETIDAQDRAWHTVHSHWTWDLGKTGDPQSSFNEAVSLDRYHTYGLEWDENQLRWYVDGKQVATYAKSTVASKLADGQWPFDKHFHLILNQSVGSGAWAAHADVSHVYETRFDWVRVYQKKGQCNTRDGVVGVESVSSPAAQLDVKVCHGGILLSSSSPVCAQVVDLSGRSMYRGIVHGDTSLQLHRGLYIVNGQKVLVP